MARQILNAHIDLVALQGKFFRRLQHQLDVTKVLQVGCDAVTADQVAERTDFGAFVPANGAQLTHDQAKSEAHDWLLRGFLREAIEATGLFLDECLQTCALMSLAASCGAKKADEVNALLHELPRKNQRLHFPQKLEKLAHEFGVSTRFNPHILSLNRARTCVVHRLGAVSPLDVDDTGRLYLTLQHMRLVARGEKTSQKLVLAPGTVVAEESMLEVQFVDRERTFVLGERIRLEASELYDIIITLWRFGLATAQSIETHGRSIGLTFSAKEDFPRFAPAPIFLDTNLG